MFSEQSFDKLEINIPKYGMNQFISPEILPNEFCHILENITINQLGSGQVRYGTREVVSLESAEEKIVKIFPFVKSNGSKQIILYVQSYFRDLTIADPLVSAQDSLSFDTDNGAKFEVDTPIKIVYTLSAVERTLYSYVKAKESEPGVVSITLENSVFPDGVITVSQIWYSAAKLYVYDLDSDALSAIETDELSLACIPRATPYQGHLLIYNGVNRMLKWDGADISEVFDFVKEQKAGTFNRIDANNFSFIRTAGFLEEKYFVGNFIKLYINKVISDLEIGAINVVGTLVTITTVEAIAAFTGDDDVYVLYKDWPPAFNYVYAGDDRLWCLGAGPAGIQFRSRDEALRVYITYKPNTLTDWFNENTKTVPSADLSDKHGITDNFEAICQINGLTAFIGRYRTQIWSGSIPGTVDGPQGDLAWLYNLSVGITHGDLLIKLPNDVYLVSPTGLQSFGTLNIAKQFAATSVNAVDPILNKFVQNITSSNINYRASCSFKYDQENIAGIKVGNNKILVSLFQTDLYSWSFFSGDFKASGSFADTGNALYLTSGNKLIKYADGNDGSRKLYGDKDGTSYISFAWIPGIMSFKTKSGSRQFSNKRYQMIVDYTSEFVLNTSNSITVKINGYTPKVFEVEDKCTFEEKGDLLDTVPLGEFRLDKTHEYINRKLSFKSSSFWVTVHGYIVNGPLVFKKLKLFGVAERNG